MFIERKKMKEQKKNVDSKKVNDRTKEICSQKERK